MKKQEISLGKKIGDYPVYVIGDVHGCYYTLMKLLEKLEQESALIFVGDLIDKGNFSKEVVEFVMNSQHQCILGNHESLMLEHMEDALSNRKSSDWSEKSYFGGYKTIAQYRHDTTTLKRDMAWMKSLPRYIEIDKYFITHAFALPYYKRRAMPEVYTGLMSNRPSDKQKWGWDWEEGYEEYDVINIYGHAVVDEIDLGKNYIGIDTGCVYGKSLSAIELGSMEVISVQVDERDIKGEINT